MSMMLIYDMGISIIINNPKIFIRKYSNWSRINKDKKLPLLEISPNNNA
jgi:hypothetical protein